METLDFLDILKYTETLDFYIKNEWDGWLSGWQVHSIFKAAQDKFGSDDKKVKAFGRKHIVNDADCGIKDIIKLGLTDQEIIDILEEPRIKMLAKSFRH